MNDGLRQLQQLVRIGIARAGNTPAALATPLDGLLPRNDTAAPHAHLWLGLAALDLWERSGFVAPDAVAAAATKPAPDEALRLCPARAEATLALLLRGSQQSALLAQWLRHLQDHGARLPERFLPKLLDMATRQSALRPALLPVLGERGRWLAALQSDWAWASAAAPLELETWHTGSLDKRVDTLRAWRARDPESARRHLAEAWKSEPPEHRSALLPQLATGLDLADEAFLEAALDDRRKEVRVAAQRLLARLPGSQLSRRMAERLLPLLRLERPLLRAQRLQLNLPADLDAAMQRDGVGAAPHRGLGEKAGWVVDMLAAVEPGFWNAHFAQPPRACLALAVQGESAGVLVRGWALAAVRHADPDGPQLRTWLRDLARWWIEAAPALRDAVPDEFFEVLAMALHTDADGALGALLDAFPRGWAGDPALVRLLHSLAGRAPQAWGSAPSQDALQLLDATLPALPAPVHAWLHRQMLDSLALVLDPASAVGFEQAWCGAEALDAQWRGALTQFFDTVRFRHKMALSFQEQA